MKRGGYVNQAWLVLLLSLTFGVALAAVQVAWGPIIEENKENDARNQVPTLVPGAAAELTPPGQDLPIERDGKVVRTYRVYRAMKKDAAGKAEQIGWVVKARGDGYADKIELLIGLDEAVETITGLYVLAQNETPGLGNKIKQSKFRDWFTGLDAKRAVSPVKDKPAKGSNQIQAVTSATISSESVCDIVNQAVRDFRANKSDLTQPEQED